MKKFSKIVVLLFVILLVSSGCKSSAIEPVSETTTVNAVSSLDLTFYKNGRDELIEAQASGCKWRTFTTWGLKEISAFQWIDYNGEIVLWPVQIDDTSILISRQDGNAKFLVKLVIEKNDIVTESVIGILPENF